MTTSELALQADLWYNKLNRILGATALLVTARSVMKERFFFHMDSLPQKTCTLCHQTKPISDFLWLNKKNRPYSWCKECSRSRSKKYYKQATSYQSMQPTAEYIPLWHKQCSRCGEVKHVDEFHRCSEVSDGYAYSCKACLYLACPREKTPEGTKRCTDCKVIKPTDDFYVSRRDGFTSRCKPCLSKYHKQFLPYKKGRSLEYYYNLTQEQYQAMLESQGGVCAICDKEERAKSPGTNEVTRLSVDHDHETGQIRSLLCRNCNTALGLLGEDPIRIESLLQYLLRWKSIDDE